MYQVFVEFQYYLRICNLLLRNIKVTLISDLVAVSPQV